MIPHTHSSTHRLRLLIVDDEPLARRRLRALLTAHPDVEITDEAEDVAGALRAARSEAPDVILLDVRIPGGDGFDVARQLLEEAAEGVRGMPFIVFVTADPSAAVPAFDVEAVDFLLEPYDAARLARALDRARAAARAPFAARARAGVGPGPLDPHPSLRHAAARRDSGGRDASRRRMGGPARGRQSSARRAAL